MIFDSSFLRRLEALTWEIKSSLRGETERGTSFRGMGNGVEFVDYRPYVPGDDLRYLDWNLLARLGIPMTKRFQEEESFAVSFFLDISPSMALGQPSKFDLTRLITAALAAIALNAQNRVGVYLFDRQLRGIFPPTRGKEGILRLFRFLEGASSDSPSRTLTESGTDFLRSAEDFLRLSPRSGQIVVLSDFLPFDHFQGGIDELRFRKNDLDLIQIYDREETNPCLAFRHGGEREFVDSETGEIQRVRLTRPLLERYKTRFAESLDAVKRYAWEKKLGFSRLASDDSLDFFLRQRASRGQGIKMKG